MRKGNCSDLDKLFYFLSKTWSFQLPTSGSRAEARSRKTWKYPLTEEKKNRKKGKLRKSFSESIKNQLPLLLPIFGCKVKISGSTRHTLNLSCPHKI